MVHLQELDEVTSYKIDVLAESLGNPDPLNPASGFALNFNTLVTGSGLLLTYLIVLLQFKTAEDDDETRILPYNDDSH